MKKVSIFIMFFICLFLFGCGNNNENEMKDAIIEDIDIGVSENILEDTDYCYDTVDYDLTDMNSNMVYSTIYMILNNPSEYIGKTFKISGTAMEIDNTSTGGSIYKSIFVSDAAACCQQGIEYVLGDDSVGDYKMIYPEDNTDCTVTGVLELYSEGDVNYMHLVRAVLN